MATESQVLRPKGKKKALWLAGAALVLLVVAGVVIAVLNSGGPGQTNLDATLAGLEEQVRQDPQNVQARLAVAIAYAARGLDDSAITQFNDALRLEENNQTALIGLGRVYLDQGDMDKALAPFLKVADLNKDNPLRFSIEQLEGVYYDLGTIYGHKGKYDTAKQYFQDALQINPVDSDAWYQLGQIQRQAGALEEAIQSFDRSVRLVPDFVEAYRAMATTYHTLGQTGKEKYAQGMVHLSGRSYDDAVKSLQEAVRLEPQMGEAFQGLGLALESMGRKEEARQNYEQALALDSTLMLAEFGLERVGNKTP